MKVEAIMTLATRDKFTLAECEELAKDLDAFDTLTFDLVGPKGRKAAKWVDAYFGIFDMEGKAFMASQFKYAHDLHCENLAFPDKPASGMEARRAAAENTDAVHDSPTAATSGGDSKP